MAVRIQQVNAEVTFPLRQRVLRPHESFDQLAQAADAHGVTVHFAAMDDGEVVGTGLVCRENPPWATDGSPSWRLRGMATAEVRRGEGIGAAVLDAVIAHVRGLGGGLLSCSARTTARSFYQRHGFTTRGESWVEPVIGPHIAMVTVVDVP